MAEETAEPNKATPTEPAPLEVPLEQQINDLPPLQYPDSENQEFQKWAEERRRGRIRVEIVGGILLLVGGVIAFAVTQRAAFAIIAVFAVAALAAYEFLVNSFE